MSTFSSSEELYTIVVGFLREMAADPELAAKLRAARVSFKVEHTDPEASMLIDTNQNPPLVVAPADDRPSDVQLAMSADDGHRFWLGELSIMPALATRRVKVAGQLPKMMGLLPAMEPAFKRYRTYLEANGFADKIPV
ncbi:MAG TPA: SCP2 sterol-binding domain-containing protein [Pseudonocardia sp.]|jgi:putative sterol carrier protein